MTRIQLAPCLLDWLDDRMPRLGGTSRIHIFACEKLPFERLYRGQKYSGLTLWNRVYIRNSFKPMQPDNLDFIGILLHEFGHVQQFREHPFLCPLKYMFFSARYGYWQNPMETEVCDQSEMLLNEYRQAAPWKNRDSSGE